jgi:hypothetical protein
MVVENCVRIAENKPKKTTSKLKYMSKCDDFFLKKREVYDINVPF